MARMPALEMDSRVLSLSVDGGEILATFHLVRCKRQSSSVWDLFRPIDQSCWKTPITKVRAVFTNHRIVWDKVRQAR